MPPFIVSLAHKLVPKKVMNKMTITKKALWCLNNEMDDSTAHFAHEEKSHNSEDGYCHLGNR